MASPWESSYPKGTYVLKFKDVFELVRSGLMHMSQKVGQNMTDLKQILL